MLPLTAQQRFGAHVRQHRVPQGRADAPDVGGPRERKSMSRQGNVCRHNLKPLLIIHLGQKCSKTPRISHYQGKVA